ncbi:MAG: hypothetical protein DRJ52_08200 [Thermoprotei archaeon]|nr:MAG: hypothetical protein DRJ52_08200 [Thermoprotei archaeon]RLE99507.1 MAG: hypothetical protein DRJ63_05180 [Thermoprotei archaeon]
MVFLDREYELEIIERGLRTKSRALVKGLRGVGKTALLKEVSSRLRAIYIDCSMILRPRHLGYVLKENWSESYEALEGLFKKVADLGKPLVLDEFTDLLERFGKLKPYRGMGGASAVASHFRGLVEAYEVPVAVATTSLKTLYELTERYSKPLARLFDIVITLKPLDYETAIKLAYLLAEEKGIEIDWETAMFLAEVSAGTPGYLRPLVSVLPAKATLEEAKRIVEREFREGYFNALFESLLRELSLSEVEVLYLISRGYRSFSDLEKRTPGINLVETLKSLENRGLVERIKYKRRVAYFIVDKTLEAWLATREFPGLSTMSFDRVRVSSIGFEALVREIFARVTFKVTITDHLGKKLTIPPVTRVYRYEGALGEVDAIVETAENKVIVVEAYFGALCPPQKIYQLERNTAIAEKITGKTVYASVLMSYFGFQPETLKRAEKSSLRIYLFTKKQIRELCEKTGYRKI